MKRWIIEHKFSLLVTALVGLIIAMSLLLVFELRKSRVESPETPEQPPVSSGQCSENWTCGSWDRCSDDGQERRECRDLNNCGTETIKPRETQTCEPFVFVEPELGPFDIEIRGDAQCQADISDALSLLEEKAPEYYTNVRKYVGVIECIDGDVSFSSPQSTPPSIEISPKRPLWSLEIIATTIVHEMLHSKLYNDYLIQNRPYFYEVPICEYGGLEKELQITREQIQLLERLGASRFDILGTQTLVDSPPRIWSDVNCEE